MSVININKNNFQEEVMNANQPVLLDFWAAWCGPCQMVGPVIEEIAAERSDIKVGKVNVDEQPELASQFQVMSIPTLVVIKDGQIVNKSIGAKPKSRFYKCCREDMKYEGNHCGRSGRRRDSRRQNPQVR